MTGTGELPEAVAVQLDATAQACFLFALAAVASGLYWRAAACARLARRRLLGRAADV